jgi:hypothetical protein
MKLEVPPLQLAEWLIHGIAVIIALMQVDSVNDRTRWPIPRAGCGDGSGTFKRCAIFWRLMPRRRKGARMRI